MDNRNNNFIINLNYSIMAPITGKILLLALDKSVGIVQEHIHNAQRKKENVLDQCKEYLLAAQEAILGLEAEYDEILVQTRLLDCNDADQIAELRLRIENYLAVDKLRPLLIKATQGIESCKEIWNADTNKWWNRPKIKGKKNRSLEEVNVLLEDLVIYLYDLDEQGLKFRRGGSGVGIKWLEYIIETLKSQLVNKRIELDNILEKAMKDRNKGRLLDFTKRITKTIVVLLAAF